MVNFNLESKNANVHIINLTTIYARYIYNIFNTASFYYTKLQKSDITLAPDRQYHLIIPTSKGPSLNISTTCITRILLKIDTLLKYASKYIITC